MEFVVANERAMAAVEGGDLHPEDCKSALADALDRFVEIGRRKPVAADRRRRQGRRAPGGRGRLVRPVGPTR